MNDILKYKKHINNKQTILNCFWKKCCIQFSNFLKIKQPEIWPIGNITGPSSMFLLPPILGGWRLDQLPYTVEGILNL